MALHGALETFPLTDVFGLLAATAKTGCLRVEGDGGRATVWLRDGAVVAATTDRVRTGPLDEVVCDLLRFEAGSFAFAVDDQAPEVDSAEDVHDLLSRAGALLIEWHELRRKVPSLDHHVTLVAVRPEGGEVTVTARQWPAIVAIGGGCTVNSLATRLRSTELQVVRTVSDLLAAGLITVAARRPTGRPTSSWGSDPDVHSAVPTSPLAEIPSGVHHQLPGRSS